MSFSNVPLKFVVHCGHSIVLSYGEILGFLDGFLWSSSLSWTLCIRLRVKDAWIWSETEKNIDLTLKIKLLLLLPYSGRWCIIVGRHDFYDLRTLLALHTECDGGCNGKIVRGNLCLFDCWTVWGQGLRPAWWRNRRCPVIVTKSSFSKSQNYYGI